VFSEILLDHFRNPRNPGELPGASAVVELSNPVCGDILKLSARVDAGRFAEVRFLCRGCTAAIACGSLVTELLRGRALADCGEITPEEITQSLGGLPEASAHAAHLAVEALRALVARLS